MITNPPLFDYLTLSPSPLPPCIHLSPHLFQENWHDHKNPGGFIRFPTHPIVQGAWSHVHIYNWTTVFAFWIFARFNNVYLYFMMTPIILLILFHEDVFSKASMIFMIDDTRLTFKEYFTSASVFLTILTSFFTGQVCLVSHKDCDPFTQVEHYPPELMSIKPWHTWSAVLSLLGTYLH